MQQDLEKIRESGQIKLSVSSHRIELIATETYRDYRNRQLPYFSILSSDRIDCNVGISHERVRQHLILSVSSHRIELIATAQSPTGAAHNSPFSILSSDRIDCNRKVSDDGLWVPIDLSVSSHRIELIATTGPRLLRHRRKSLSVSSHRIELIATLSGVYQPLEISATFSILSSDRIDCNKGAKRDGVKSEDLSVSSHRIELIAT